MRISSVVGEGVRLVRRYERVQYSSLAIALSARRFDLCPISPVRLGVGLLQGALQPQHLALLRVFHQSPTRILVL